jgi:hypothetical protein
MITGLRRGELSALRWRDVDFERRYLLIQRSNAQPKTAVKEKGTKTGQQRRIAIDEETLSLLVEHHERLAARCGALGSALTPDCWLFSTAADSTTPYPPRSLSQRYRRLASKLTLRSTRLHSLRHYSATELIAAGVDIRTVAGRLGHGSGGGTTLRVYAAWVDEADRRAAEMMASIMPRRVISAPTPRAPYEVIAAQLRNKIQSGQLTAGERLPTVIELATDHVVSAGTAHRAIALLAAEGLVDVARGRRATVKAASC